MSFLKASKRIDSITGLRALAMLAVFGYHLFPENVPGGFLGVVVFFVISGYLFTSKLLGEVERNGYFSPLEIVWSRAKRLYGPLIFMLAVVLLWSRFLQLSVFRDGYSAVKAILFGYDNIAQINRGLSYFDMHGLFRPFVHLWALSLEMQFYLFYPFLLWLAVSVSKKRTVILDVLLALGAVASAYAMYYNYSNGAELTRVYYGTDTRMFSFLIGAFFSSVDYKRVRGSLNSVNMLVELLAGVAVIIAFFFADVKSPALYSWGLPLYSVVCAVFVRALVKEEGIFGIILSSRPFKFIGERSYSIYLFQYAVQVLFMEYFSHRIASGFTRIWLQIPVVLILAEISHRLFELKCERVFCDFRRIFVIGTLVILLAMPFYVQTEDFESRSVAEAIEEQQARREAEEALRIQLEKKRARDKAFAEEIKEKTELMRAYIAAAVPETKPEKESEPKNENTDIVNEQSEDLDALYSRVALISERYPQAALDYDELEALRNVRITAVGDSVLLMAESDLKSFFPNSYMDTKVSRQLYNSIGLIEEIKAARGFNDIVVIALGTNGDFNYEKLAEINEIIERRQLIIVNTIMPDAWEQSVNEKIARLANENENVVLVDWYGTAKQEKTLFYDDRTHPVPDGAMLYAQLIAKAISECIQR